MSGPSILSGSEPHTYSGDYQKEQLRKTSWDRDFTFTSEEAVDLVLPGQLDLTEFSRTGHTIETAQRNDDTLWKDNEAQGKEHAFENIYHKIACCMGWDNTKTMSIPLITNYDPDTKEYDVTKIGVEFDTSDAACTFRGVNYKDPNALSTTANDKCERLIQKLTAVVNKYDSNLLNGDQTNEFQDILGCFNLMALPQSLREDPGRLQTFLGKEEHKNRRNYLEKCQSGRSYLGNTDRSPESRVICTANVGAGNNIDADQAAMILKEIDIDQNCGGTSKDDVCSKAGLVFDQTSMSCVEPPSTDTTTDTPSTDTTTDTPSTDTPSTDTTTDTPSTDTTTGTPSTDTPSTDTTTDTPSTDDDDDEDNQMMYIIIGLVVALLMSMSAAAIVMVM